MFDNISVTESRPWGFHLLSAVQVFFFYLAKVKLLAFVQISLWILFFLGEKKNLKLNK